MKGIKDLTKGAIHKQLFNLALPIMATSFIQMAYSLTDMAWVGRLGSEAVAAVGAAGMFSWVANSISLLNKVGSEVSVGQSIGARNQEDARHFASHNITIALIISLSLGLILFVFAHPIISVFKMQSEIAHNSVSYLRIISTAFPFVFLSAAFSGIYNASGRSTVPFYITGSGLVMNMLLDPLFIFGFGWGIEGAGYATWVSQATVFSLFVYQLRCRDVLLDRFPFLTRLRKKYSVRILKLGAPVALFNTLFAFVNIFLGRTASQYGGHLGLTALTTGGQIEAITWNTSQGFSTALGAFIAQNYAARQSQRVFKAWHTTLWMTLVFGGFCTLLFVCFGTELFSVFVPEEAASLAGGTYLRIVGYSQLFMMLEITTQGVFYGIGRTMPPAIISITFNYLRIPLAILLTSKGMGVEGIWWSISLSSIAKGIVLACWFKLIQRKVFS
ncbi:MATE family efflux transporter [Bacteroides sp. 214]|uniref:MATE family efflux transporter n=1 Tax=Bacteroides sp. 214 TaxID=2302935 RepID=UPI0013D52185|nr:MATE family efflux transporter [Bacteroides sp. 214]NDW12961.1 MATE family efflux transporter [Bacteroides sp. 214]